MSSLLSPILEYARRHEEDHFRPWRRIEGARIDLHCHSSFSKEVSRWLPGMSYRPTAEPEEVYAQAKARGMDFVTLTDHDTIDGCKALVERCGEPADFIFGEEVTVSFPEDGTQIHMGVFGIDEAEHREIQRLRDNIYDLTDYLRSRDKLFVLNHMTWTAQHRVLAGWQIEAVLRLFDVFEGINGTRGYAHNAFAWYATRGRNKVLVGGSDSHTHRVGSTYTISHGETREELLANIRAGRAAPGGAFGTAEKLREDVWLVLQRTIEDRMAQTTRLWERFACRAVRRLGQAIYPLVCLGYNRRQDNLIQEFVRLLPA